MRKKNNLLGKIDEVPNKETIIIKNSNYLSNKKAKPKKRQRLGVKFGAEARNTVSDGIKSQEKEKNSKEYKCKMCDYLCEKDSTLKKHMNSKHTEQTCKQCGKEFRT